jgi:VWFA-related protein
MSKSSSASVSLRSLAFTIPAVLLSVPAAAGQQSPSVQTVRIDALAVDGRGASIRNLTARDFDVRENEQPVNVEEARFVEDTARPIAIYIDEYHISAGASAERVRTVLSELVDRHIGDTDSIVVMKPLDSIVTIRRHTREEARRIIAAVEGRRDDYTPRTDYERAYMADAPERVETARHQVAISALNALAVYLGTSGASRKTLLLVTETLEEPARRRGQEYLATTSSVIQAANRSNVSIYTLDPTPGAGEATASDVAHALADQTNGRNVASSSNLDDLGRGIRDMMADASAYYMLTYQAAHPEDGTFHPVRVSVRRSNVQVRARSGYWAPAANDRLGAELLAAAARPAPPLRLEPMRRNSPLIRPWFGLSMGDEGKMRVTFVWEPSGNVPGDPARTAAARLELTAIGDGDAVLFKGPVLPTGPAALNGARGEPSRAVFDVVPGPLRLRMTIQDAERRDVDTDVRDFAVRDLRGRIAIGTPEFLRARNAREFRLIDSDPQAVPVSSREFSRAERLLIRFPAYAPEGQRLSVAARLLNRAGQPMRALEVRSSPGSADAAHEIEVTLAGLATGDYQVEVEVSGAAEKITERVGFRVTS